MFQASPLRPYPNFVGSPKLSLPHEKLNSEIRNGLSRILRSVVDRSEFGRLVFVEINVQQQLDGLKISRLELLSRERRFFRIGEVALKPVGAAQHKPRVGGVLADIRRFVRLLDCLLPFTQPNVSCRKAQQRIPRARALPDRFLEFIDRGVVQVKLQVGRAEIRMCFCSVLPIRRYGPQHLKRAEVILGVDEGPGPLQPFVRVRTRA